MRIHIVDTHAHQSTTQARDHFSEFGISSKGNNTDLEDLLYASLIQPYVDHSLEQIAFPEPIRCTFT